MLPQAAKKGDAIREGFNMFRLAALLPILLFWPTGALAVQTHGGPEGLYAHQMAHLFFTFAMGLLIYWLRTRRLVAEAGWRLIQYAALFFMLWNLDAFAAHQLEAPTALLTISRPEQWRLQVETIPSWQWLAVVYYIVKLDHLLCVPAALFLFLGLRRLAKSAPESEGGRNAP